MYVLLLTTTSASGPAAAGSMFTTTFHNLEQQETLAVLRHVPVSPVCCGSVHHQRRPETGVLHSVGQWTGVERCY